MDNEEPIGIFPRCPKCNDPLWEEDQHVCPTPEEVEERKKAKENHLVTLKKLTEDFEKDISDGRDEYLAYCAKMYDDWATTLKKIWYGDQNG
jgi:hypothetical protein